MNLVDVSFPVYRLGRNPPTKNEGVSFYIRGNKPLIVDDSNISEDTLAKRRLHLSIVEKAPMYRLKQAIFFIADLIKLSGPNQWFIDSKGKVFRYLKTKHVPLVFRKITKVLRQPGCCLVEVQGINGRHMSLFHPLEGQNYAGFLRLSPKTYVLYGFFEEQYKDTRRKI